jgi:hypothetical protein
MRQLTKRRNDLLVALGLMVLNGFFVAQLVGLSYDRFTWEAYAQGYGPGEDGTPQSCSDGIDNNTNNLIDCADPACFGVYPCAASAPTVSFPGLISLGVVLGSIGLLALRRRRTE